MNAFTSTGSGAQPVNSPSQPEDDVLHLISGVASDARKVSENLQEKEAAVRNARRRVAALRQTLLAQSLSTERGHREALVCRVRIREAECAIARVRLLTSQTFNPNERAAAQRERDAARRLAAELKVRVEVLGRLVGDGAGADSKCAMLRRKRDELKELIQRLSSELAKLEQQHRSVREMAIKMEAAASDNPDRQVACGRVHELEERWVQQSGIMLPTRCLDKGEDNEIKDPIEPPCDHLLQETEERSASMHQLCLAVQDICSLLD